MPYGVRYLLRAYGRSRPKKSNSYVLLYVIALTLFFQKWGHTLIKYLISLHIGKNELYGKNS